jgi:methylthioribose-1-phosphate isomerase
MGHDDELRTIFFRDGRVMMIDQTALPLLYRMHACETVDCLIEAIGMLRVRGAPALGAAGAYGVLLSALEHKDEERETFYRRVAEDGERLARARPTAVNLSWGVNAQLALLDPAMGPIEMIARLEDNAERIAEADVANNRRIGRNGAHLIDEGDAILTHCNAGALACVGYGTALGVVRAAHEDGKDIHVYVDETRPLCQGARLTAWELVRDKIPATLVTDNMAGSLMQAGKVDKVVVGADRISAKGDVANKIGTYSLAVLARHHGIPLIVAAPVSTIDFSCAGPDDIPIEERDGNEVRFCCGVQIAPMEVGTYNPAFDITPASLVDAIVTENGVARPPNERSLRALKS